MKFDTPAGATPIDRLTVVGRAHPRVEGKFKTTGTARYAAEHHKVTPNTAYGYILGAAIAKGRIGRIDAVEALAAPGVRAIVTHENAGPIGKGKFYVQRVLAGPTIDHYHQAVAVVVADSFEQARAAASLIRVDYTRGKGSFDLAAKKPTAPIAPKEEFGGPT